MKNNIIFISGVKLETTPVLAYAKTTLNENYNSIVITYNHKRILQFIWASLKVIINTKNVKSIFFIGPQTLPILLICQFFIKYRIYFWALESFKFKFIKSSLIEKALLLEYLIYWGKITLIVPSMERLNFYKKDKYYKYFIVENTPPLGISFNPKILNVDGKIKLVMYGRLDDTDIYLKEFIEFAQKYDSAIELNLIGWDFKDNSTIANNRNIIFHGFCDHSQLLFLLNDFHFSIIGYRPFNYNNRFCAPNKLYEAFSLSLPVIVNNLNPPLESIVNRNKAGIIWNFSNLNEDFYTELIESYNIYEKLVKNSYNSYTCNFNFNMKFSQILEDLMYDNN